MSKQSVTVHDFHKSLAIGERGEILLLQYCPHLIKQPPHSYDFLDPNTNLKYELKSDSYGLSGSPNFFMERWSSFEKGTEGGPWQALSHKADYFLYMYPKDKTYFLFSTALLVEFLNSKKWPSVSVRNKSWTTIGFKVPRAECAHLFKQIKLEGDPQTLLLELE